MTSKYFTNALEARGTRYSMDDKGSWRDNVFIDRLRRSPKYGNVYLRAFDALRVARERIGNDPGHNHNHDRPNSSLGKLTPARDHAQYRAEAAEPTPSPAGLVAGSPLLKAW